MPRSASKSTAVARKILIDGETFGLRGVVVADPIRVPPEVLPYRVFPTGGVLRSNDRCAVGLIIGDLGSRCGFLPNTAARFEPLKGFELNRPNPPLYAMLALTESTVILDAAFPVIDHF
jgi:hypothetical protein